MRTETKTMRSVLIVGLSLFMATTASAAERRTKTPPRDDGSWSVGYVVHLGPGAVPGGHALGIRLLGPELLLEWELGGGYARATSAVAAGTGTPSVGSEHLAVGTALAIGWVVRRSKRMRLYPELGGFVGYQRSGPTWELTGGGRLGLGLDYTLPGIRDLQLRVGTGIAVTVGRDVFATGLYGRIGWLWRFASR